MEVEQSVISKPLYMRAQLSPSFFPAHKAGPGCCELCWIVYIICKDSINYSFVGSHAVTLLLSDYLFAELQNYNNTEYDKLGLDPAIVIA